MRGRAGRHPPLLRISGRASQGLNGKGLTGKGGPGRGQSMCPGPEAGVRFLPLPRSGTFQIISWQPGVRWLSRQRGWEARLLSDQELLLTRQAGRGHRGHCGQPCKERLGSGLGGGEGCGQKGTGRRPAWPPPRSVEGRVQRPWAGLFQEGFAEELGQAFSLTAAHMGLSTSRSAPARSLRPGLLWARGSLRRHPTPPPHTHAYSLCTRLDLTSVPAASLRAHSYVHFHSHGRRASGIDGAPSPQTDPVRARFLVGEARSI